MEVKVNIEDIDLIKRLAHTKGRIKVLTKQLEEEESVLNVIISKLEELNDKDTTDTLIDQIESIQSMEGSSGERKNPPQGQLEKINLKINIEDFIKKE